MSSCSADVRWMRLALHLGARGLGTTWPNPSVGCVIVNDNHVVGRGWTQPGGRPHAERMALDQAQTAAQGATAYVTLEPCAHIGQTTPCADALIERGIARVVAALQDPDPRVSGQGFRKLEKAGVKITTPFMATEARTTHIGFLKRITENRPMVTLKLAGSIDGKIATQTGESQWITGPEARHYVHYLRATHDAVMIGKGTSVADNPDLTVRLAGLKNRSPVRIVIDSHLSTPANNQLGRSAYDVPVWLCHGPKAQKESIKQWENTGATVLHCNVNGNLISIKEALTQIAEKGITRLLCEGGGKLGASLIKAGCVDRLIVFSAGLTVGNEGIENLGALHVRQLSKTAKFQIVSHRQIGNDLMSEWIPV